MKSSTHLKLTKKKSRREAGYMQDINQLKKFGIKRLTTILLFYILGILLLHVYNQYTFTQIDSNEKLLNQRIDDVNESYDLMILTLELQGMTNTFNEDEANEELEANKNLVENTYTIWVDAVQKLTSRNDLVGEVKISVDEGYEEFYEKLKVIHESNSSNYQRQQEENVRDREEFAFIRNMILFIILAITLLAGAYGIYNIQKNNIEIHAFAQKALEASQTKSQFLANMSHEIRTPLNAIIGFAEILTKKIEEPIEQEYAQVIAKSGQSLLAIINDILDLSKIESGKVILEMKAFNLREMLEHVVKLYSLRADEKGLELIFVFDEKIASRIMGDSLRIQQVVGNLLGNAIKFTPTGGTITFSVVALESYQQQVYIEFSIKDTGIGIPKEAQKQIFKPFTQADGGVTKRFGGTGLGLTISQKNLEAMGSSLELISFPRQGSTFKFKVFFDKESVELDDEIEPLNEGCYYGVYPYHLAVSEGNERLWKYLKTKGHIKYIYEDFCDEEFRVIFLISREQSMKDLETLKLLYPMCQFVIVGDRSRVAHYQDGAFIFHVHPPYLESHLEAMYQMICPKSKNDLGIEDVLFDGRVLVAEDNSTNRLLVQILLEKLGLEVSFAKDGFEVVQMAKANRYDMIFMDIHMPNKDGVTAFRQIQFDEQDNHKFHTPIIALTANALVGDEQKYIDMGMDGYISKPIALNDLIRELNRFLVKSSSRKYKTYNFEQALSKIGVDQITLNMLLHNFFLTFDKDLERLTLALESKNRDNILEIVHYLIGSYMNLHFESAVMELKNLQEMTRKDEYYAFDIEGLRSYFMNIKLKMSI
jgi:two-component system, NarL family, sensor histidine kinase BarA